MVEAYASALKDGRNGYSPSYGITALREAIARDEQRKGWPASADDVYVCHGVTEALQLIFAAVLEEGSKVLAPDPITHPTWPILRCTVQKPWNTNFTATMSGNLISAIFAQKWTTMFVCWCSSTPTIRAARCAGRQVDALLAIARDYPNCIVVADEIYDGLDFTGQHVSVASRSSDVPVIALNGVSKVYYAPGWRIGYMALHDPTNRLPLVRDRVERLLRSRLCASTPAQLGYLAGL